MSAPWTAEADALVIKLLGESWSYSQIAAELGGGVTRDSVIGRIHRLRQKGVSAPSPKANRMAVAKCDAKRRKPKVTLPRMASHTEIDTFMGLPAGHSPSPFMPGRVAFLDRKLGQCAFPLWSDHDRPPIHLRFVCGEPCTFGAYCEEHRAICAGGGTPSERQAHRVPSEGKEAA